MSYFRELYGDLAGAVGAMRARHRRRRAGAENVAYVQTCSAISSSPAATAPRPGAPTAPRSPRFPGYAPADAGLARSTPPHGDLAPRSPAGAASSTRLPLPEYVIALGETELAAGRRAAARRDLALVSASSRCSPPRA